MADITYNGLSSPTNIISFTDIPNILKLSQYAFESTKAYYSLRFVGNLASVTSGDSQWYITLFGDTISNVLDYRNAVNKSFYVSSTSTNSTAASVARALRNCPNLAANFIVEQDGDTVTVTARVAGQTTINFETNIPQGYMSGSGDGGFDPDYSLNGALIDVDVYGYDNEQGDYAYVTTLEKSFYNDECAFDMSPVLTSMSDIGRVVKYGFKVSALKNGEYALLGDIFDNYNTVGYMCNQGYKYITNDYLNIAQNFSRGESRGGIENNTILYVYKPSIPISFFAGGNGGMTINIQYLDSAFNQIASATTSWRNTDSSRILWDLNLSLNTNPQTASAFTDSFYVDITLGTQTVRYNVIKPLKATEHCQRILWRNEYGGISFVDLTGAKTVSNDISNETYQKSIYDYYEAEINSLDRVYDVSVKTTYTLKSHLMEADGRWIYYSLMESPMVWTEVNGEKYEIIIDSVSVDEQNQNDVYEATVKFHFSQPITLL